MSNLDPTALVLADVEADYDEALAELARIKVMRRLKRRAHRDAIVTALTNAPTVTNVDLAARFAVTEGTIRNIRRSLATPTP